MKADICIISLRIGVWCTTISKYWFQARTLKRILSSSSRLYKLVFPVQPLLEPWILEPLKYFIHERCIYQTWCSIVLYANARGCVLNSPLCSAVWDHDFHHEPDKRKTKKCWSRRRSSPRLQLVVLLVKRLNPFGIKESDPQGCRGWRYPLRVFTRNAMRAPLPF